MRGVLRVAKKEDIPQMVAIYNDAILSKISTADISLVDEKDQLKEFLRHDKKRYPIWVNEYHQKVIAFLGLKPFYGRAGYDKTCEVGIYIDKNFQGKKLGQKFLCEAITKSKELGFQNLLAFIFKDNLVSIKLFKKFGFKEWGNLPGVACIEGVEKDLVILGLRHE